MARNVVITGEVAQAEYTPRTNKDTGEIKEYGSVVLLDRDLCERVQLDLGYPVTDRAVTELKKLVGKEGAIARVHVLIESEDSRRKDPRFSLVEVLSVSGGAAAAKPAA